jgi:hypothetical protein
LTPAEKIAYNVDEGEVGEYDIGGGGLQIGQILQETAGLKGQCHEISLLLVFFMNQSSTPVANLPPVSLIPVVHQLTWGWGETDS